MYVIKKTFRINSEAIKLGLANFFLLETSCSLQLSLLGLYEPCQTTSIYHPLFTVVCSSKKNLKYVFLNFKFMQVNVNGQISPRNIQLFLFFFLYLFYLYCDLFMRDKYNYGMPYGVYFFIINAFNFAFTYSYV